MFILRAFIALVLASVIQCQQWPEWPWDFRYEIAGNQGSDACTQINEAMAFTDFFYDNYFCVKSGSQYKDIGMEFSNNGTIPGKKCILVNEPSSYWYWFDNHICFNNDVPYDIKWSYTGCLPGKACISWNDPGTPHWHTFWDNFLCADATDATKEYKKCAACGLKAGFLFIFTAVLYAVYIFSF